MKKKIMTLALTAAMAASMGMTAFAGQWVQNTTGWWWQEDNGSYPVSQWKWLEIKMASTNATHLIQTDICTRIQQPRTAIQ